MAVKTPRLQLSRTLVLLVALWSIGAQAQITPSGDSYTNSAAPTTNYGAKTLLGVDGATQISYIQFDLGSIPSGANVSQATLKLYVNSVTSAGSFNVDFVNGGWSEGTIDFNNAPALGSTIVASVPITTADKNQYVLINITPALQAWLNGSQTNDGIALVANGSFNATFDSKENTTTSHPAEIDVVFAAGGGGGITGVTAGTDLTGGGTSGNVTLNVDTTKVVTGIVPGTDLTGGGTGGVLTLNLDTTKVPQLAAANTFTGNQTVNGNVSATGLVSGTGFLIGSNLFDYGSYANGNAFMGFAGNSTMTGKYNTGSGELALAQDTTGNYNTANGWEALYSNTTGNENTAYGWVALGNNSGGGANTAVGFEALLSNTTGNSNTANGSGALYSNVTGFQNTAVGYGTLFFSTANDNTAVGAAALQYDTTGATNVAVGWESLGANTTGNYNTAIGPFSLELNTTGSNNTAVGLVAGYTPDLKSTTGSNNTFVGSYTIVGGPNETTVSNATAIGANTEVDQSNAMVLGSINGVNGATADTAVGIGTTTPLNTPLGGNPPTKLNIVGNNTYVPLVVQSPSTFGTWMVLNNTSTGGKPWAILSAASGNGEGAGNLGITDFGAGGTIFLEGNVSVSGNLSKGGGSFKIDHPVDPANKYLYHSFVESPDMMNIYNGNVVTDRRGLATIELPDWFEALNRDFRYQLTVIGQFAQAIVVKKVEQNRFTIKTNKPKVEVSWLVTGVRQDAYANAYRIPVEEMKPPQEQGHYLHPELFGAGAEKSRNADQHEPSPATVTQTAVQSPAID